MFRIFKEISKFLLKNKIFFFGIISLVFIFSASFTAFYTLKSNYANEISDYNKKSKIQDLNLDLDIDTKNVLPNNAYREQVRVFESKTTETIISLRSEEDFVDVREIRDEDGKLFLDSKKFFKFSEISEKFLNFINNKRSSELIFNFSENPYFYLNKDSENNFLKLNIYPFLNMNKSEEEPRFFLIEKGKKYFFPRSWVFIARKKTFFEQHKYILNFDFFDLRTDEKNNFINLKNAIWNGTNKILINNFFQSNFFKKNFLSFSYWKKYSILSFENRPGKSIKTDLIVIDDDLNLPIFDLKNQQLVTTISNLEIREKDERVEDFLERITNTNIYSNKIGQIKERGREIIKEEIIYKVNGLYPDSKNYVKVASQSDEKKIIDNPNIGIRQTLTIDEDSDNIVHLVNLGDSNGILWNVKSNVGKAVDLSKQGQRLFTILPPNTVTNNLIFEREYIPKILSFSFKGFNTDDNYLNINTIFSSFTDYFPKTKLSYEVENSKIILLKKIISNPSYDSFANERKFGVTSKDGGNHFIILENRDGRWYNLLKKELDYSDLVDYFESNSSLTLDAIVSKMGWRLKHPSKPKEHYVPFIWLGVVDSIFEKFKGNNNILIDLIFQKAVTLYTSNEFLESGWFLNSDVATILFEAIEASFSENDSGDLLIRGKFDIDKIQKIIIGIFEKLSSKDFLSKASNVGFVYDHRNFISSIFENLLRKILKRYQSIPIINRREYFESQIGSILNLITSSEFWENKLPTFVPRFINSLIKDKELFFESLIKLFYTFNWAKFAELNKKLYLSRIWSYQEGSDFYEPITISELVFNLFQSVDGSLFKRVLIQLLNSLDLDINNLLKSINPGVKEIRVRIDLQGLLQEIINLFDWNKFLDSLRKSFQNQRESFVISGKIVTKEKHYLPNEAIFFSILDSLLGSGDGITKLTRLLVDKLALANNSISDFAAYFSSTDRSLLKPELLSLINFFEIFKDRLGLFNLDINKKVVLEDTLSDSLNFFSKKGGDINLEEFVNEDVVGLLSLTNLLDENEINNQAAMRAKLKILKKIFASFSLDKLKDQGRGFFNKINVLESDTESTPDYNFGDAALSSALTPIRSDFLLGLLVQRYVINNYLEESIQNPLNSLRLTFSVYNYWIQFANSLHLYDRNLSLKEIKRILLDLIDLATKADTLIFKQLSNIDNSYKEITPNLGFITEGARLNSNLINTIFKTDPLNNFTHPEILAFTQRNPEAKQFLIKNKLASFEELALLNYSNLSSGGKLLVGNNYLNLIKDFIEKLGDGQTNSFLEDAEELEILAEVSNSLSKAYQQLEFFGLPKLIVNPLLLAQFPFLLITLIINPDKLAYYKGDLAFLVYRLLEKIKNTNLPTIFNQQIGFRESSSKLKKLATESKIILDEKKYNQLADWLSKNSFFGFDFGKDFLKKTLGIFLKRQNNFIFFSLLEPQAQLIKVNRAYLLANKKQVYNADFPTNSLKLQEFINNLDDSYTIKIKGIKYLIVGEDMAADYLYPVIDENNLKVDTKRQVVAFVNELGFFRLREYEQIKTYLLLKAPAGENLLAFKQRLIKTLEEGGIINPETKVFLYNEIDPLNPERALRLTIPLTLVSTINLVSIILIIITTLLTLTAICFVLKRFVDSRKRPLGILISLGYSRWEIGVAFLPFSLLFSFLGSLIGSIFGVIIKSIMVDSLATLWVLPLTTSDNFLLAHLISFLLSFALCSLVTLVAITILLRENPINIINSSNEITFNRLTLAILKLFRRLAFKIKFVLALSIKQLAKLIVLATSIALSAYVTLFGFVISGVFNEAIERSFKQQNYNYRIELTTPTVEGGAYATFSKFSLEDKIYVPSMNLYDAEGKPYNILTTNLSANPKIFSPQEAAVLPGKKTNQLTPVVFSKTSLSLTFDTFLGINPWEILSSSLPESRRQQIIKTLTRVAHKLEQTQFKKDSSGGYIIPKANLDYFEYILPDNQDPNNIETLAGRFIYRQWDPIFKKYTNREIDDKLAPKLREFLVNAYKLIEDSDYFFSFGGILFNPNGSRRVTNETYSYADVNFAGKKIRIDGYKPDSKFISIVDASGKNLLTKMLPLWTKESKKQKRVYPVIINKVFATTTGLKEGDVFKVELLNDVKRYYDFFKEEADSLTKVAELRVVAVNDTYIGEEIITLQTVVNALTGLETLNFRASPIDGYAGEPFNAIISKDSLPEQALNSILLYSPAGFWSKRINISTDESDVGGLRDFLRGVFGKGSVLEERGITWEMILKRILKFQQKSALEIEDALKKYPDIDSFIAEEVNLQQALSAFISIYGSNLYIPAPRMVYSNQLVKEFVNRTSKTSTSLVALFATSFFIILAIILLIISNIIILENKINIGITTILGFRRREIFLMFFSFYLPIILLSSLLVIPLLLLTFNPFNSFLATSFSFVIPLSLSIKDIFLMLILEFILFFLVTYYSWFQLRGITIGDISRGE